MTARGFVAVVGSRELPEGWAAQVAEVVGCFVARGWGIGSGGARGADRYALEAVVAAGRPACARSVVFLPGTSGAARAQALGAFAAQGGRVVPGAGVGRAALLGRSRRLARASSGVVAFLWGPSRGSVFTVRCAVQAEKPAAVVLAGGGAALPAFVGGAWAPCRIRAVEAFRWVPAGGGSGGSGESREPGDAGGGEPGARRTALGRIFVVDDGEPVGALLEHVSALSQGERLWFEQGVLAGDTVLVPHEALSDTPAWLGVPRLRRRFGCTVPEAAGLGELFLALEARPDVVAWYEAQARRRGVAAVIEELVGLVAALALAEECPEADALTDAECLGEWAGGVVTDDGRVARLPADFGAAGGAQLAWHALGAVHSSLVECPGCGALYAGDDEAAALPVCPACGVADTWEARQGAGFRALVAEIDGCASLGELAALGKRLYALAPPLSLSREQAGVAWSHYQLRKAALEAAITLGAQALVLVGEIEQAPARRLSALGAWLYRLQHSGVGAALSAVEWRQVWQAYQARKAAQTLSFTSRTASSR